MAIENFPVIKKVNNPYEFAPVVPLNIKKVDISKPNVPLVQTAPIVYKKPNPVVAPKKQTPVAPVKTPSINRDDLVQAMIQKNPRLADAYSKGEVTDADIIQASIQKYPKVKQSVLDGDVDLNTAQNIGVNSGPGIVEKAGSALAGAAEGILDNANKVNQTIKKVTNFGIPNPINDLQQQAYNKGKEVFDPLKKSAPTEFGIGKTVGKIASTMAMTPGLGQVRGLGLLGRGALGATEGAVQTQIGSYINEGKAASLKDTLIGAGIGSVARGVFKPKGGSLQQTEKLVMPKLTPNVEADRAAMGLKKISMLGKAKMLPTNQEREMARVAQTILRPNKTIIDNIGRIRKSLDTETDDLIKVVKDNPVTFSTKEIISRMKKIEKPLMIRGGENEAKYDAVIKKFEDILSRQSKKNAEGLLKARKEFDNWVNIEIPNLYNSDSNVPLKTAISKLRKIPNDWLNEKIGDNIVKESLKKQSQYIDIIDNLSTKTEKTGSTRLSRWAENNKKKIGFAKWLAGAGVAGAGIGAGGKIIGRESISE